MAKAPGQRAYEKWLALFGVVNIRWFWLLRSDKAKWAQIEDELARELGGKNG